MLAGAVDVYAMLLKWVSKKRTSRSVDAITLGYDQSEIRTGREENRMCGAQVAVWERLSIDDL